MSDDKKEFPINEMHGYKHIKSQLVSDVGIMVYDEFNRPLGVILKPASLSYPSFYPDITQVIVLKIEQLQELVRYMEFIQRFGISVKFKEDKDE